jgi:hypothetical protein
MSSAQIIGWGSEAPPVVDPREKLVDDQWSIFPEDAIIAVVRC